ncbi:MAG: hypothetical protein COW28_05520, partial [bacterium (Candidatus Ratteibacteria) CG15_BIG_FIL_POST_REV_8_21_14_020_41_12]
IAFPPTTEDRQGEYEKTPKVDCPYNKNFQVEVVNEGYKSDGTSPATDDETAIRKITVDIYRKKDDAKMVTLTTYISRNGAI